MFLLNGIHRNSNTDTMTFTIQNVPIKLRYVLYSLKKDEGFTIQNVSIK